MPTNKQDQNKSTMGSPSTNRQDQTRDQGRKNVSQTDKDQQNKSGLGRDQDRSSDMSGKERSSDR